MKAKFENDTLIAKAKRDYELKKAAYDIEVQTKVLFKSFHTTQVACENSSLSLFVPAKNVSPRETSAPQQQKFHADGVKSFW